ncbi:MAG: carbohydrate binding domain-containing protein [Chloroherpetonaceae bacterium]|nr:hypothetical protein [Chthonomonadaceae bacterium]MDW8208996.1 carbohydrate binding domain-containing protein [Chloroherpetonaceae bacterium]
MRCQRVRGVFAIAFLALPGVVVGQQAPIVQRYRFDADNTGWNVESTNAATAEITRTEGEFKTGAGAIKVKYTIEKGQFSALSLPVEPGKWAQARQITFWLKTDRDTAMLFAVHEKDGGHYHATIWSPGNVWQQITLTSQDFSPGMEPTDPKDPNQRLDMDRIEKVFLTDLANLLIQSVSPDDPFLKVEGGLRTFWLDEVEVRSDAPPASRLPREGAVLIDAFPYGYLSWLPLGTGSPVIRLDRSGMPFAGPAMQMTYTQEQGKPAIAVRGVSRDLSGCKSLVLDIASEQDVQLLISLEEHNGGRYQTIVTVAGGRQAQQKVLPFSQFRMADDSPPDANGKLDLDRVKTMGFADLAFLGPVAKKTNTLWIARVYALPPEQSGS